MNIAEVPKDFLTIAVEEINFVEIAGISLTGKIARGKIDFNYNKGEKRKKYEKLNVGDCFYPITMDVPVKGVVYMKTDKEHTAICLNNGGMESFLSDDEVAPLIDITLTVGEW